MSKQSKQPEPGRGNFFEDFHLGQVFHHATPRTITEGDCSFYIALTGSRHILHCAQPVAHAMGYRNHTVDDLLAFHIAFGKTVRIFRSMPWPIWVMPMCVFFCRSIRATP